MKDILVHFRDFRNRTSGAEYGGRLAAAIGASMTGLCVCPRPVYIAPAYGPEGIMTAMMENARQQAEVAVQAQSSFVEWAASLGVRDANWLVAEGDRSDAIAQAAARHDLVVLDHAAAGEERVLSSGIPRVLLKADAPCMVVPHHGASFRPFERIAVAWNGSPEAMRAVRAALPFLRGSQVLLLCGEERNVVPGVEWHPPFDVTRYLERHGATVDERALLETRDDVGGVLLEDALEFGADLVVMGAYGRSRFSEWVLGGATRYVLAWADIPVLFRH